MSYIARRRTPTRLGSATTAWLRAVSDSVASTHVDPLGLALALRRVGTELPAWSELIDQRLEKLMERSDLTLDVAEAIASLQQVDSACPQIAGVDAPRVMLSRAEWVDGGLYLCLDVVAAPKPPGHCEDGQALRWTTLRLVGVQPRQWEVEAPAGTTIEALMSATIIRTPLASGPIALIPGSY